METIEDGDMELVVGMGMNSVRVRNKAPKIPETLFITKGFFLTVGEYGQVLLGVDSKHDGVTNKSTGIFLFEDEELIICPKLGGLANTIHEAREYDDCEQGRAFAANLISDYNLKPGENATLSWEQAAKIFAFVNENCRRDAFL